MDRSTNKFNAIPRQIDTTINIQSCRSATFLIVSTNVIFLMKSHDSPSTGSLPLLLLLLFTFDCVNVVPVQSFRSTLYVRNNKCSFLAISSNKTDIHTAMRCYSMLFEFLRKINKTKMHKMFIIICCFVCDMHYRCSSFVCDFLHLLLCFVVAGRLGTHKNAISMTRMVRIVQPVADVFAYLF